MFHLRWGFLDRGPYYCLVVYFRVFAWWIVKPEKYNLFSSVSVAKYTYSLSELIPVEARLFFEFSFCSTFMTFSIFNPSFREHESSLFMHDTEEFCFSSPLTYTYTSSAYIQPDVARELFLDFFEEVSESHIFLLYIFFENENYLLF